MASRYASRDADEAEKSMRHVQGQSEGNAWCADCSTPRPEYLNLTIGTFICENCAAIHRTSSNRRVKDMYARDLTPDDVRRMREVGNDVANRKWLGRWNPREFPEPAPGDKEHLREFIWLKYEGSWKRGNAPHPSRGPGGTPSQGLMRGDFVTSHPLSQHSYEPSGLQNLREPPRAPLRREEQPARSFWADRFASPDPSQPVLSSSRHLSRRDGYDEDYNQPSRTLAESVDYRRRTLQPPSRQSSHYEESIDEDYAPVDDDRVRRSKKEKSRLSSQNPASALKKKSSSKKPTKTVVSDDDTNSESSTDEDLRQAKKNAKKKRSGSAASSSAKSRTSSSKVKSKQSKLVDSDSDDDRRGNRKSVSRKKATDAAKKVSRRSSKRGESPSEEEKGAFGSTSGSAESFDSDDDTKHRKKPVSSRKQSGRATNDTKTGENPFASDSDDGDGTVRTGTIANGNDRAAGQASPRVRKPHEYDLMSDWMNADKAGNGSPVNSGPPQQQAGQQHMHHPVMPPMSIYPGMFAPGAMMMQPGVSMMPHPGMMHPFGGGMMAPGMPGMTSMLPNSFIPQMQNLSMQPPPPMQQQIPQQPPPPPPPLATGAMDSKFAPPPPPGAPPS
jgi:Putative GTPase activating protein for Arf